MYTAYTSASGKFSVSASAAVAGHYTVGALHPALIDSTNANLGSPVLLAPQTASDAFDIVALNLAPTQYSLDQNPTALLEQSQSSTQVCCCAANVFCVLLLTLFLGATCYPIPLLC